MNSVNVICFIFIYFIFITNATENKYDFGTEIFKLSLSLHSLGAGESGKSTFVKQIK